MELIHSEDRDQFKMQLNWRSALPQDAADITLDQAMQPGTSITDHQSVTSRVPAVRLETYPSHQTRQRLAFCIVFFYTELSPLCFS